jgi:putative addiction module component (TIGR02574 family)
VAHARTGYDHLAGLKTPKAAPGAAEPAGFKSLSKAEQIRYLQNLWDRIAKGPGQLPVPKSHLSLAKERLAEYRRNPTRARPAHDVLRDLT